MQLKQSKILVAGASGLIGRAVVNRLVHADMKNVLSPSRSELDLENYDQVLRYFVSHKPDVVVLAAGLVGGISQNSLEPVKFLTRNLLMAMNVSLAADIVNVRRVVLFGSSCMYPKHCSQPMEEKMLWSGKLESTSLSYATAKIAAFQLGFSYNSERSLDRFLCVIPNSAYGPGDNFNPDSGHVLSALITKFHSAKLASAESVELWGTGNPMREFVFSYDIADAVLFLLENDVSTATEPINIGSGHEISISNLASQIASIVGYEGKIFWNRSRPDGTYRKLLDSSKINALGWKASTSFEKGIDETYSWYVRNQ